MLIAGTQMQAKILQPFLYQKLQSRSLQKPILVRFLAQNAETETYFRSSTSAQTAAGLQGRLQRTATCRGGI